MTLYAIINDDKVIDLSFIVEGCIISMASSSMFTSIGNGRSLIEMEELNTAMEEIILQGREVEDERLEDAVCLSHINKLPGRNNCALMPWQAFQKLIKKKDSSPLMFDDENKVHNNN